MTRRIPVLLSILSSLLCAPFLHCVAQETTEQVSLDFGSCEIHVVSVDLHGTLADGEGEIKPHDRNHRLVVVRLRIQSLVEGVVVLTPGSFRIVFKVDGR